MAASPPSCKNGERQKNTHDSKIDNIGENDGTLDVPRHRDAILGVEPEINRMISCGEPPRLFLLTRSSDIAQVRVRGSCSVAVTNPRVFAQMLGDSARMATQVKGITVNKVTDALFEVSLGKSGLIDIISSSDEMAVMVKAITEPPLNTIGLTLKQFEIHAIVAAEHPRQFTG
ncbi:MAG: SPFH domain-containing protein [Planctomycetes bacterium]|nr:SPFH domain-containing protein [Planctomycetota bacterium]